MKEMLLALRKAVDQALATDVSTEEIPLAEFPSHVVKSLEAIIGDTDAARAGRRLVALQAELDEACALVKRKHSPRPVVREDREGCEIVVEVQNGITTRRTEATS